MPGKKGKSGGKRSNAGRKPTLNGKRYRVYLDEESYTILTKYARITHDKPRYKLSETMRDILQEHDRKHSKKISSANSRSFNSILEELLNSENSYDYLHHEIREIINRSYTKWKRSQTLTPNPIPIETIIQHIFKEHKIPILQHIPALSNYLSQYGIEASNPELIIRYLLQYCETTKGTIPAHINQSNIDQY